MPQTLVPTSSSSNFQTIFESALEEYEKKTKKDLRSYPLYSKLELDTNNHSPVAVLTALRQLDQSRSVDDKLIRWLNPTVSVIYNLSQAITEDFGLVTLAYQPAGAIFTAIGVLLSAANDVPDCRDALADVFERVEGLFRRLELYTEIQLPTGMADMVAKIMAEVLHVLAAMTKEIKRSRANKFVKKLRGRTELEDTLGRLDRLTQEQVWMMTAEILRSTFDIDHKIHTIMDDNLLASTLSTSKLDHFTSAPAAISIFRGQMKAFNEFRKDNTLLMTWLESIVDILFMLPKKFEEGQQAPSVLARTICAAVEALLDTAKALEEIHDPLVDLFERIQFFLQRINNFSETPLSPELKSRLLEVMTETHSTLASFTKMAKDDMRFRSILMGPRRTTGIIDVLQLVCRLDELTREDTFTSVTRHSEIPHHNDGGIITEGPSGTRDVNNRVDTNYGDNSELYTGGEERATGSLKAETTGCLASPNAGPVQSGSTSTGTQAQLQAQFRAWLTPDHSINHDNASETRKPDGRTTEWFIQDSKTFQSWKKPKDSKSKNCSLLWIFGNGGSGKTVLCSAIINDLISPRVAQPDLVAHYYFDTRDPAKRDIWGLLASLVIQLGGKSESCWSALSQLYADCSGVSARPSATALKLCLKRMLATVIEQQRPIYIVIDAVDHCPNTTGPHSPRKEVLMFVEDLVRTRYPTLHICLTSSPEQDIKKALNLLTSALCLVNIDEEAGQQKDIESYIRSFVEDKQETVRTKNDKEHIINTLAKQAHGNFRWVSRWLHGSILGHVCSNPNGFGTPLDETFGRKLQDIPKEKHQHALLLFQCLIASIRPLCVKELGEILATELDLDPILNREEAVRSACPNLIDIVEEIVRFSRPEMMEFLTSERLPALYPDISHYSTSLEAAHRALSRACICVLLRLGETVDKADLENSPLASYAIQYWVWHTQQCNVAPQNQDIMKLLFDPNKPHQEWIWMCDIKKVQKRATGGISSISSPRTPTPCPLYYAGLYGFSELISYLVTVCGDTVSTNSGYHGTPLHAASYKGHVNTVQTLIDARADVKATNCYKTPLHAAFYGGHLEAMRLLLKAGADPDARDISRNTLLHQASLNGQVEFVDLLLDNAADPKASNENGWTPLHRAALCGHVDVVRHLLKYSADVNAQSQDKNTPLHIASMAGKRAVVQLLLEHGADPNIQGEDNQTSHAMAKKRGHGDIVKLLSERGHVGFEFSLENEVFEPVFWAKWENSA